MPSLAVCIAWWDGLMRRNRKCSKFLRIVQQQSCILQTRTESQKLYIVSGVWWSVNWFYQLKRKNRTFACRQTQRYFIVSTPSRRDNDVNTKRFFSKYFLIMLRHHNDFLITSLCCICHLSLAQIVIIVQRFSY